LGRIDIPTIYGQTRTRFQDAVNARELNELLLIYNRKSLTNRISGIFGLKNGQYDKLLVRLFKGSRKEELIQAMRLYLPQIN
jgi:selenocysteine lyase/cysteine desulfurase